MNADSSECSNIDSILEPFADAQELEVATQPYFPDHKSTLDTSRIHSLPTTLALPLLWARHMPLEDVLNLTVEKLFAVTSTELERMGHKNGKQPLKPLRVPPWLWGITLGCVAARLAANCAEDSERLTIVATQWCGTPVFTDPEEFFWDAKRFRLAVETASAQGRPLSSLETSWEIFSARALGGEVVSDATIRHERAGSVEQST